MHNFLPCTAGAIMLAASLPAFAQGSTEPVADCQELVEAIGSFITLTDRSVVTDTADGCRLTEFFLVPEPPSRFKVAELALVAPTVLRDWSSSQLPAEVDLTLSGVLISPDTGSELSTYLIEMQADSMDIHLSYQWDQKQGTLEVSDLSVASGDQGAFRFQGRVSNLPPELLPSGDFTRSSGRLDELRIELDHARFFAVFAAPPLVSLLPYDEDPRPLIANYIATASAFISSLPVETASNPTKEALLALVQSFPRFRGDYTFSLAAEPGISIEDFSGADLAEILAALRRVKLEATHAP